MLRITDLGYSIDGRPLLEGASAVIPAGHKVGIVGPNGCGKTTLFRLIRGELALDTGAIEMPRGARIGGVDQEVPAGPESLADVVLAADRERAALMDEAETATDPNRIAEIHARLADIQAHSAEARASSILSGLGFAPRLHSTPTADFSGGWRMRVALAAVLFSAPDILLLDEPTNYLDLEGAMWLESYLARYPHTALVISHDRNLLNRAVGSILHLHQHKLRLYSGGYDSFERQRAANAAQDAAMARQAQARRDHLQSFVDRFRYKASKAKQAQARLKMIERLPVIETEAQAQHIRFSFPTPTQLSPPLISVDEGEVGYNGQPVLKGLKLRVSQDDRIAFLGANGQGKSTLSKLLSGNLDLMAGSMKRVNKLRVGYFAQHQMDELEADATPLDHVARLYPDVAPAKLRARLGGFGLLGEVTITPAGRLSGGQRARLALFLATHDAPHILVLDEPTNHLDIDSRRALSEALLNFEGAVILVSHDMTLLEMCADELWLVKDGKVTTFTDDLEAYRRLLLGDKGGQGRKSKASARPDKAERRRNLAPLRSELARCEDRLEKLHGMKAGLDAELANPATYGDEKRARLAYLQGKTAELAAATDKAEALWLAASEALEKAQGNDR